MGALFHAVASRSGRRRTTLWPRITRRDARDGLLRDDDECRERLSAGHAAGSARFRGRQSRPPLLAEADARLCPQQARCRGACAGERPDNALLHPGRRVAGRPVPAEAGSELASASEPTHLTPAATGRTARQEVRLVSGFRRPFDLPVLAAGCACWAP